MSGPRIADRELASAEQVDPTHRGLATRFGAAIASPVGIMLAVPGLVCAVGLLLTVLGQNALSESSTQLGRDRFSEQTAFVARSVAASLQQTDPMLDRMRELVLTRGQEMTPMAWSLRGLMRGRPGIAYASVSYADGTFFGAYLDDDHGLRFQEVRVTDQGAVMRRYDYEGLERLVLRSEKPTTYDPRRREFFRVAVETRKRVWTRPYTFFSSKHTGVTRTEAVFDSGDEQQVRAVLTADFDVQALSGSMLHTPLAGSRTLLYTREGTLLAYPEGASVVARLPQAADRPLSLADLHDPVVDAFSPLAREQPSAARFQEFSAAGQVNLAMIVAVPVYPELGWSVAAIVPKKAFFHARAVHERQSLIAALVSLLAALAISVVFARHVVRFRRDVQEARDKVREANDRVRELGSYRLVERLGEGGMGEVWRAEHRLLARQAAVKLIRKQVVPSAGAPMDMLRARFRREAQTLARLKSRHTIQLFDFGVTHDGTFFFVMELLDGMDLDTLVERHGPQPAGRVIHLLLQACSSLAEAHQAGLVHRDVKPANVFVCLAADEVDIVKVLDFGLVMAPADEPAAGAPAHQLTQSGQHMGTPAAMAPEQALGKPLDGRADIYALGCVAWWLLTGHMPFESKTSLDTMISHVHKPLPDLAGLVPGFHPDGLDRVVRQCLAKSPDDRPSDARVLADLLRAIELPAEQVWTVERARAWWAERRCLRTTSN